MGAGVAKRGETFRSSGSYYPLRDKIMKTFWREVFSDNGQGSFARIAAAFTVASAMVCLLYHTFHTGHVPDAMASGGLATFGISPYAASRTMSAVGSFAGKDNGPRP